MEKAKAAVSNFLSKDGKHQTSVDQDVKPAVTEEHINPHQHENVTTAVDREVHKDHHYTTVQPVTDKQTLPEQHHHNIIPVEHKSVEHGGQRELKDTLDRDAAQYQSTSTTHDTTHTQSAVPVVAGERVHHHVHEHVQPVVQKEVVEPHVVHTTIPIHETHNAAPVHHGTKVAPTKTLDEFVTGGGKLEGGSNKALFDYEGCPETENSASKTDGAGAAGAGLGGLGASTHHHHDHSSTTRGQDVNDTSAFGAAGTTGATDTTTGTTSDRNTSKPSVTEKITGALSGQSIPTEKHEHQHEKHDTKHDGSFFGKDKTQSETTKSKSALGTSTHDTTTQSGLGTSTRDNTNATGIEEHGLNKGDHYKHGVTGADTFATDRVNDEGAFGGPGSVPRSDVTNTTTGQPSSDPLQSWRAGETHREVEGDTHKTGQAHPSLIDKINPFKDADGDGKKGFMK